MIFPFNPAPYYMLAAALACPTPAPPVITTTYSEKPPIYTSAISTDELTKQHKDTKVYAKPDEIFKTGGLTRGTTGANFKIRFQTLTDRNTGEMCIWPSNIDLAISYSAEIFIASENKNGTCQYKAIVGHEQRHVATDVITIRQYMPALKTSFEAAAAQLPRGPVRNQTEAKLRQQNIEAAITATLQSQMAQMEKTRIGRQQAIDTREEYMRLSKVCR